MTAQGICLIVIATLVVIGGIIYLLCKGGGDDERHKPRNRGQYYSKTLGGMVDDMRSDAEFENDANKSRS